MTVIPLKSRGECKKSNIVSKMVHRNSFTQELMTFSQIGHGGFSASVFAGVSISCANLVNEYAICIKFYPPGLINKA